MAGFIDELRGRLVTPHIAVDGHVARTGKRRKTGIAGRALGGDDGRHRTLVDVEAEDVGARIVTRHVEVVLAARDLAEVELRDENHRTLEMRAGKNLAERRDDAASAAHQHRARVVVLDRVVVFGAVRTGEVLTGTQHKTTTLERHVPRMVESQVSRSSAVGAQ